MSRAHEFPAKVKVAAFQRAEGKCEDCKTKLQTGRIRYDHILPIEFGGLSVLENCQVLCTPCDAKKTYGQDIPAIAKSNRIRAKHLGAKAPSRNPIPGSKRSKWKRKMDGSVVLRDSE